MSETASKPCQIVQFDVRRLPDRVLNLIVDAAGCGWLFDCLLAERHRRVSGDAEEVPLILPSLEASQLRSEYLECQQSLLAIERRQEQLLDLGDAVGAGELSAALQLFSEIALAIQRTAIPGAPAWLN